MRDDLVRTAVIISVKLYYHYPYYSHDAGMVYPTHGTRNKYNILLHYYVLIYCRRNRGSMSILQIHIAVIKNVYSRKWEVSLRIIRARRGLVELVREKENRTISMYLIVDNNVIMYEYIKSFERLTWGVFVLICPSPLYKYA